MQLDRWVELLYCLIIVFASTFIYFKTRRIYKLTSHKGIKSFRNAFFFFGVAFLVRLLAFFISFYHISSTIQITATVIFNYFLSMAGFSVVYSLVWKNIPENRKYFFHPLALAIAIIDVFTHHYMIIVSQLAVFAYAMIVSYGNYKKSRDKSNFLQLYFIGLVLALISYFFNLLSNIVPLIYIYARAVTASAFVIFLYGVMKTLKWRKKESA